MSPRLVWHSSRGDLSTKWVRWCYGDVFDSDVLPEKQTNGVDVARCDGDQWHWVRSVHCSLTPPRRYRNAADIKGISGSVAVFARTIFAIPRKVRGDKNAVRTAAATVQISQARRVHSSARTLKHQPEWQRACMKVLFRVSVGHSQPSNETYTWPHVDDDGRRTLNCCIA